jgi:hypothetical protein
MGKDNNLNADREWTVLEVRTMLFSQESPTAKNNGATEPRGKHSIREEYQDINTQIVADIYRSFNRSDNITHIYR